MLSELHVIAGLGQNGRFDVNFFLGARRARACVREGGRAGWRAGGRAGGSAPLPSPELIHAGVRKYLKHFLTLYYAENCFGFDNLSFSLDTVLHVD